MSACYFHPSPDHKRAEIERLVAAPPPAKIVVIRGALNDGEAAHSIARIFQATCSRFYSASR